MSLEDIGFYTLEDSRAAAVGVDSPLWRCELILTSACNFACPYCRGVEEERCGSMSWDEATRILDGWCSEGLRNVRFSGGEPTLWKRLPELVERAVTGGVRRVAISTNGSAPRALYERLLAAGVNDFSISLDACCAETGDLMAGGKSGAWGRVVENVRFLSPLAYVTVGVVLTEDNVPEFEKTVLFAHSLGVADIRVISAAQWNERLRDVDFPPEVLRAHPILAYRVANLRSGRHVRGIPSDGPSRCPLVLDDMAVLAGAHWPCIIHLRERGDPIGTTEGTMREVREARRAWFEATDPRSEPICSANCLDVCVDYNARVRCLGGPSASAFPEASAATFKAEK